MNHKTVASKEQRFLIGGLGRGIFGKAAKKKTHYKRKGHGRDLRSKRHAGIGLIT